MSSSGNNASGEGVGSGSGRGFRGGFRGGYRGQSRGHGGGRGRGRGNSGPNRRGGGTPFIVEGHFRGTISGLRNVLDSIPEDTVIDVNAGRFIDTGSQRPRVDKRSRDEDEERDDRSKKPKLGPRQPEVIDPNVCGNCGADSHNAAFCVKTGESGWMEACPKCDSLRHLYETCPRRVKGEEDFTYLIFNRQRKPPVKSRMILGKVIKKELERDGTAWKSSTTLQLPYSSMFARQEARQNRPEDWTYPHVGNPSKEALSRLAEPTRSETTLGLAADGGMAISVQAWTQNEETADFDNDGPIPTMRLLKDIRGYTSTSSGALRSLSRLMSVGARNRVQPTVSVCANCGLEDGHDTSVCNMSCATCGADTHAVYECDRPLDACVCRKRPGHVMADCDGICSYCRTMGIQADTHHIVDCPVVCQYCGDSDHTAKQCTARREMDRRCTSCFKKGARDAYHFRAQCPNTFCPVKDCSTPLKCLHHCRGCGWNMEELMPLEDDDTPHNCQFEKTWQLAPNGSYVIMLSCQTCKNSFKHEELLGAREQVQKEVQAIFDREGYIDEWPNACPMCRACKIDIDIKEESEVL
ncbi:hypothetical protein F5Y14DRAFT_449783 [Nemania sp. NC0429]|nr:hypothetical protein F5Y14DRAFT_449783 [Nemania sp. NC0429]